jgi:sigma-B regulation protein RsbU (phosphoserine phosphatase)
MPDGRIGVLIADVSGKGAAAAVLMAILRSIVHDEVDRTGFMGPAALLGYADRRLRAMGLSERGAFVTAFCGVFDPSSGQLIYSCAGHNPPRLLHVLNRTIVSLDGAATFPLGLTEEPDGHTEAAAVLRPGDIALFYTDGITEAVSPDNDFFGVERLDEVLRTLPDPLSASAAVQAVSHATVTFAANAPPTDDQTLVALARLPAPK